MDYDLIIDLDNVTIQDCIDLFDYKGVNTIINDGHIVNFEREEENGYNQSN